MVTDARVSEGEVSNYKTELRQKMQEDLELKEKLRSLQVELDQVCAKCMIYMLIHHTQGFENKLAAAGDSGGCIHLFFKQCK